MEFSDTKVFYTKGVKKEVKEAFEEHQTYHETKAAGTSLIQAPADTDGGEEIYQDIIS
ncbi:hypothetical protein ACP70R_038180 [Stipagrostis hirtigluma subsp. patula]